MICKEVGCNSEVDTTRGVPMRVSCISFETAHPCVKCGRLHWANGEAVFNRQNHRSFFLEEDKITLKDERGDIVCEHPVGR